MKQVWEMLLDETSTKEEFENLCNVAFVHLLKATESYKKLITKKCQELQQKGQARSVSSEGDKREEKECDLHIENRLPQVPRKVAWSELLAKRSSFSKSRIRALAMLTSSELQKVAEFHSWGDTKALVGQGVAPTGDLRTQALELFDSIHRLFLLATSANSSLFTSNVPDASAMTTTASKSIFYEYSTFIHRVLSFEALNAAFSGQFIDRSSNLTSQLRFILSDNFINILSEDNTSTMKIGFSLAAIFIALVIVFLVIIDRSTFVLRQHQSATFLKLRTLSSDFIQDAIEKLCVELDSPLFESEANKEVPVIGKSESSVARYWRMVSKWFPIQNIVTGLTLIGISSYLIWSLSSDISFAEKSTGVQIYISELLVSSQGAWVFNKHRSAQSSILGSVNDTRAVLQYYLSTSGKALNVLRDGDSSRNPSIPPIDSFSELESYLVYSNDIGEYDLLTENGNTLDIITNGLNEGMDQSDLDPQFDALLVFNNLWSDASDELDGVLKDRLNSLLLKSSIFIFVQIMIILGDAYIRYLIFKKKKGMELFR
ncbi:hypothetical protein HDU97_003861 [Phlyctochytrium planicorne]|nr:hypothetical protein HDU97_003861 [Phlyctochytrium planicorne]